MIARYAKNIIIWFIRAMIAIILIYTIWLVFQKLTEISDKFFGFFSHAIFGKTVWIADLAAFLVVVIFFGFLMDARFTKNRITPFMSPFFMKLLKSIPVFGELFIRKPFLAPYWGTAQLRHTACISSIVEKMGGEYIITIAYWHLPPLMLQCSENVEVEIGISREQALSFSFGGGITLENAKSQLKTTTITLGELIRREGYVNMIQPAS